MTALKSTPNPAPRRSSGARPSKPWRLSDFLPYHLSFTSELISMKQAQMVHEATGLSISEWRVMAVIASFQPMSTRTVASFTTMNKVAVSRAVKTLVERGYVTRGINEEDSRLLKLELSEEGRIVFQQLVAVVSQWSGALFSALTPDEITTFKSLLGKLRQTLRATTEHDWPLNEKQLFGDT